MSCNLPYDLSPAQKASFDKDGFLLIPDLLNPDEVSALQSYTAEVKSWPARPGQHMPYEETRADGTTGLCRTESRSPRCYPDADYANYHTGFDELFRGKRLTGILGELMGERAVLFKEKINYKEAGGSGGFDAHIDAK